MGLEEENIKSTACSCLANAYCVVCSCEVNSHTNPDHFYGIFFSPPHDDYPLDKNGRPINWDMYEYLKKRKNKKTKSGMSGTYNSYLNSGLGGYFR